MRPLARRFAAFYSVYSAGVKAYRVKIGNYRLLASHCKMFDLPSELLHKSEFFGKL